MPEFAYTARNAAGDQIAGSIAAATKRDALCALMDQAMFPMHVEMAQADDASLLGRFRLKRGVKPELIAANLTQLADLLENGVPLLNALGILVDQATHDGLAEVLTDVRDRVVEGESLDCALARHPHVFGELTVSMVRAGTEGAFLEDALKRTAGFLELQEERKARLRGAMAYPAFLAFAGVTVTVVLVVFFVPKFAELYAQLEQQGGLPTATVMLLFLSDVLGRYGVIVAAALVGLVLWLKQQLQTDRGRTFLDRWKLRIPVAGPIFLGAAVSRFCRVLGTLLRNGVPLLRALEISRESAGNRLLADAIRRSAENVTSGDTLSKPLRECGLIPAPIMAMIRVAEESNNLENVLINIAEGIDRKTNRQLDIMIRMVEPVMLMVMGTVIMFVLVALLLPVFDMSATLS